MTHTDLKQVILDYMNEIYNKEFIGRIEISDIEPYGYKISFNLNNTENPVVIIGEYNDEDFLKFIKEEIRSRKFHRVKYFKTYKLQ